MRVEKKLARCTGYDTEMLMTSRHESGRSDGPAFFTLRVSTLYTPASDINKVGHSISDQHTGGAFSVSVPANARALAEDAIAGFLCCFKKVIPLFLEFLC